MRRFRVTGSSRVVSAAASRTLLATIAVASAVIAFGGLGAAQGRPPGAQPTATGTPIPGLANVSGTVQSPSPFTAARVYLRNVDRQILYMVYTARGRYRAVALLPGDYEVGVSAEGFASDLRGLTLKAGDTLALDFSLHPTSSPREELNPYAGRAKVVSYDEIYPPAPGLDILERTCMVCHGEDFASSRPASRDIWAGRIDYMQGRALWDRPPRRYAEGLLSFRNTAARFSVGDRAVLLDYLVAHFGPRAEPRVPRIDQEMPLEEDKLGRAMYIEYYFTPDPPGQLSNAPEYNSRRRGQDIRFDAQGNVWGNDRNFPHRLVKLDPRTGEQKEWLYPDPVNGSHEVLIDPTGIVWLPEHQGRKASGKKRLLGFNPQTEEFEHIIAMDPDDVIRSENKWMQSLAMDSKMNIYVGWLFGGALSKYERATGKVTVYPLPVINGMPYGVVADSQDHIILGDYGSGHLYRFDPENESWTTFTPPTYPAQVRRPNVDDEDNIWYPIYAQGPRTERFGKLGVLDQRTGKFTEYAVPRQQARPYDVAQDPFGNIWSADGGGRFAAIWSFDTEDETFTIYPKPQPEADSPKIQITRDGAIWYSPRGSDDAPGMAVLYPDMDKITSVESLGAYYKNGPPGYPFAPAGGRN